MTDQDRITWIKYVNLIASMAMDTLMNKGPSDKAFVANLKLMADNMDKLIGKDDA